MSSTVVRREGDLVVLEHKYYGKFSFRDAPSAALADAAAASAEVFAGERTDGQEPRRVALKFDTGNQVYNDHLRWRDLYYDEAARFAGLPWVHSQTIPEAPWRGGRADVMVSQLLGASLEARTLPARAVCCIAVQVLDMLAAMHATGLVHRDIKPANLLLPLEAAPPQQLHIIDFGIAGKINAHGAAQGQNPDGTALYAHRGTALRQPVSFRDDLEALGYTLLMLAAGRLPWEELALQTVSKKAADQRLRDVAKLKLSARAAGIAAVAAPPLADALTAYFDALRLETASDNAARFDYAALRAIFTAAYQTLARAPYAHGIDWTDDTAAEGAAAEAPRSARKRKQAEAAAEEQEEEAASAPKQPRSAARGRAAAAAAEPRAPRSARLRGEAPSPAAEPATRRRRGA